jgi:uncharacterized protein YjbJ (UPF0337 family)
MDEKEPEVSLEKGPGRIKEAAGKVSQNPNTLNQGQTERVNGEERTQAGKIQDDPIVEEYYYLGRN